MHSSKDAARMELRASTRHANPYSFPPTPGSGLLGSTTRTASHPTTHAARHRVTASRSATELRSATAPRSSDQCENLRHSWQAALQNLSTEPLGHAATLRA